MGFFDEITIDEAEWQVSEAKKELAKIDVFFSEHAGKPIDKPARDHFACHFVKIGGWEGEMPVYVKDEFAYSRLVESASMTAQQYMDRHNGYVNRD